MRNSAALCLFIVSLYACTGIEKTVTTDQSDYTRFVDPFIGTAQHGHVFLGANVPFGAVQLGPVNITHGWDWCSGYNYADSTIYGFAHTHLSGTGIGDLGDIVIMPVTGEVTLKKGIAGDQESGYYSLFSHDEEIARPGYYSVYLKRYGVKAELTTTERVGFHQYQFPAGEVAKTIIDLEYGIGWDAPVETMLQQVNDSTLAGYRYSKGWAVDQRIYFTAIFSKPVKHFALYDSTSSINRNQAKGKRIKAVLTFGDIKDEVLKIKVGISPVSTENAAGNIAAEVPGWDFDAVRQSAHEAWNNE
ncbi:MAG TPA: glycoside hydrolase family 92 protein, partial [Parasegetibacter sp.]